MQTPKRHVLIRTQGRPAGHPRSACQEKGCSAVWDAFLAEFQQRNLWADFQATNTGCLGPCGNGPSVLVYPEGVMYGGVTVPDVKTLIDEHLIGGTSVARLQVPVSVW